MKIRKTLALGGLLAALLPLNGCFLVAAGAVAGAGAYSYQLGKLDSTQDRPIDVVHRASVDALKELNIQILSENSDKLTGQVTGRNAQSQDVKIEENRVTDSSTRMTIRVGTGLMSDDKTQTLAIYDKIQSHLK